MSIRNVARGFLVASLVACGLTASAGVFVQPTPSELSGTSASGIPWTAVSTGTALPVRTTATNAFNGAPGAVVYFNTTTGQLQIDPKNLDLTTVIITYTTGTVNISGTTAGPLVYPSGTTTNAISPTTGTPKTFPAVTAVTGLPPTTFAARVGMTIGAPLGPSLATAGDVGNIASTSGYWNQPWAFPLDLVASGSTGVMTISNFKTIGQNSNANANILGYGLGFSTFQYSANGITGNQVGAVIPVVPEPSTVVLASVGLAVAGSLKLRRRKQQKQAATLDGAMAG
jgi:hypothetical protein